MRTKGNSSSRSCKRSKYRSDIEDRPSKYRRAVAKPLCDNRLSVWRKRKETNGGKKQRELAFRDVLERVQTQEQERLQVYAEASVLY